MKEEVPVEGGSVSVGTITVKAAREAQMRNKAGKDFEDAFVLESLKAGGTANPEAAADALGLFTDLPLVHAAAMRVNGLKVPKKGEDQPEGPASTSSTSTGS